MIGSILSSAGGSLGRYLGGGILSTIGRYTGRLVGDYFEKKWFKQKKFHNKFTNIRDSFHISMAKYGSPIPLIFGRAQIPGQIIWADEIIQTRNSNSVTKYIKSKNTEITKQTTNLEYYLSFAMSICVGKIEDIERVWCGDDLVDIGKYKFKLYKGDEEQLPDPTIESKLGELTPSYRGLAYIVFEKLPLAEFGDVIPNFTFEVLRKPKIQTKACVEDMVESMVMIPGSGEFVYDTNIQTKFRVSEGGKHVNIRKINSHNHYNIANSVHSLNQLKSTCPNVKWVSPVVCWFGTNIDANKCFIKPAVEFKDPVARFSEEWRVGKYTRQNAHEITKNIHSSPIYGGSINDASIIRYLEELKAREHNIMFYPMFQMDVPGKPWRGRLSCSPENVSHFFNKHGGYNEFILHYANLVKDHVDAFVIGSELIGLTRINKNNYYPAVEELILLAGKVKKIVGKKVKVTYAADWSEYHHTEGGWYNLDPLWSSANIDFIGIDAYFPITDTVSSYISKEDIEKGFQSGEGYDYYIDSSNNSKKPLTPPYAWKNIKYWWENTHTNPNGKNTGWIPKSKPIWFTEYGFPSIDKATNQPNVFFDNHCVDGGIPKNSSGDTNFAIQRVAIKAFIEFWKSQEYIEEMFLWCWDARPYPAWPVTNAWGDGYLWEKGHWVNYKFGATNLASILLEISNRCGIDTDKIDVSSVNEKIDGLVFCHEITGLSAINTLRAAYFFDINAHYKDIISFKKRGANNHTNQIDHLIMPLTNNSYTEISKTDEISKINTLGIYYINYNDSYNQHYMGFNKELKSASQNVSLNLPLVLNPYEVDIIGSSILQNAHNENEIIRLKIYNYKIDIVPSEFIQVNDFNKSYIIRVIDINLSNNESIVTGVVDKQSNYALQKPSNYLFTPTESYTDSNLIILDLPFHIEEASGSYLAIYFCGNNKSSLYSRLPDKHKDNWNYITNLDTTNAICEIVSHSYSDKANIFMIDTRGKLIISGDSLEENNTNNWQHALVGKEIIKFNKIKKLETGIYEISNIIHGLYGTEKEIHTEKNGEYFILLEQNPNILQISEKLKHQTISFEAAKVQKTIRFENEAQNNLKPFIVTSEIISDNLYLKWVDRIRVEDSWNSGFNKTQKNYKIIINSNQEKYEYLSDSNEFNINISDLSLSDDFEINIITKQIKY